jgi:hypothetical protein
LALISKKYPNRLVIHAILPPNKNIITKPDAPTAIPRGVLILFMRVAPEGFTTLPLRSLERSATSGMPMEAILTLLRNSTAQNPRVATKVNQIKIITGPKVTPRPELPGINRTHTKKTEESRKRGNNTRYAVFIEVECNSVT